MNNMFDDQAPTVPEQFAGCRGLSMGFRTAGLDRDCYVIAGAQTLRLALRPGGFSDFSNIIRMIP